MINLYKLLSVTDGLSGSDMDSMGIGDVWQMVQDLLMEFMGNISSILDNMLLTVSNINDVQFDEYEVINGFLGNIKYIIGTPMYTLLIGGMQIGAGLLLFHLIIVLKNFVSSQIPKLFSKGNLPTT